MLLTSPILNICNYVILFFWQKCLAFPCLIALVMNIFVNIWIMGTSSIHDNRTFPLFGCVHNSCCIWIGIHFVYLYLVFLCWYFSLNSVRVNSFKQRPLKTAGSVVGNSSSVQRLFCKTEQAKNNNLKSMLLWITEL